MALIRIDHVPETVKSNLPLNIIVPEPGMMQGVPIRERKVLYLLHGLSDDASAWQRYSSIETYARLYGLVVVMPSSGRSFSIDQPNGQAYFSYLIDELPRYLEDVFGIVPKRENTLIAGISMGGYGAMKAALLHPERYCVAASFSGVLSLAIMALLPDDPRKVEFAQLFGELEKLPGSEHDPAVWLQRAVEAHATLPKLFIACARQEDVYPLSVMFTQSCRSRGVQVDYHEEDGQHDWLFWDKQIQRFLALALGPS
jgi:S-formylglutathione hydrolase FrmB